MLKVNPKHVLPACAMLTAIAPFAIGPADAKPRIRDLSIKVVGPAPKIYVDAKNGRYYRISDRSVAFTVRISANARGVANYIKHMGVGFQDGFALPPAGSGPGMIYKALEAKTFKGRGEKAKASVDLYIARAGNKIGIIAQTRRKIIAACNKLIDQGRSPFEQHKTRVDPFAFRGGAVAHYYRMGFLEGFVTAQKVIGLDPVIVCLPDPTPFKVKKAKLSYTAIGNKCPRKLTINTVIESNRPGKGLYRRDRKGGPSSAWIPFQTRKVGNRYLFQKQETQEVGHVNQLRAITIEGGPASPWTRIKVDCDRFKVTQAKYAYKVKAGGSCPRKMTITMTLHANQKGHAWVRHERKGGPPGKWFKVTFIKKGKSYIATSSSVQKVGEVDQVRWFRVKDGPLSNRVHFRNDCSPMKLSRVQLGIVVAKTKSCPKTVTFKSWVFANKAGWAKVRYRKAGGGKSAWYPVKVRKGAGGIYMGSHTVKRTFTKAADTKYMAEVQGAGKISTWVPLRLSCAIGPGSLGKSKAKRAFKKSANAVLTKPKRIRRSRKAN